MGKNSHSGAGKRKSLSASRSKRNKDVWKAELDKNDKQIGKAEEKSTEAGEASSELNRNLPKNGRYAFYFCMFVGVLAIVWPLSLYRDENQDLWANFGFLQSFFNVNGKSRVEKAHVPSQGKQDVDIWTLERRSNLSLDEFVEKYDGKRPVLITDALTGWKANDWNKDFFVRNYGNQQVHMKAVHGSLQQAEGLALPVHLFAKHSAHGSPSTWTYLEDELFIQLHPELRSHLGDPIYLKEDFFQLFPTEVRPWNAMLLWGTAYSRSTLHIDPYNWTGTNAVFSGKKLWKLYPPGQDDYLYLIRNRKSEFPLNCFKYNSPIDAFQPDLKTYPRFSKARAISFEQRPGELLIIPPGWFHQAFNEVETIAVSSQVMNSQNFHIVLEEIFKAGNIDRNKLPSAFYELTAVDQVLHVMRSLPPKIIIRGKEVTNDILKQMGYLTI